MPDIFEKVTALGFPPGEYVVVASGVLEAIGIRKARDVDMTVTPELFERLRASGEWREVERWGKIFLEKDGFDIIPELSWPAYPTTTKQAIASAMMIRSIPFLNLDELIKFKRALGRKKDLADIELIEARLKKE
ncbi:hypothetical protein KGQ74_03360 [Patescibacteria group bacterium]|nr:hypothetical protein [Patescibacteria group bacterium]